MLVKVSEAEGVALDYLVAKALWSKVTISTFGPLFGKGFKAPCIDGRAIRFQPTVNRSHGSEIIEREGIAAFRDSVWSIADPRSSPIKWESSAGTVWTAVTGEYFLANPSGNSPAGDFQMTGPTLLIAAMRCYVASKLGYEVEVPDGLVQAVG